MQRSANRSLGALLVGAGLCVDRRWLDRLETAVKALIDRANEAERDVAALTKSNRDHAAHAVRKDAELAQLNEQLCDLKERVNRLQLENERYEVLIARNNAMASQLILMKEGRLAFGELRAEHDRFFEIVVTVFNASVFQLCPTNVGGRIRFGGRLMLTSTIEIVRTDNFPVQHGSSGTFTIRVVPIQAETAEAIVRSAQRSEMVEMDLSELAITFSGDYGREYLVKLFHGVTRWQSDIYGRRNDAILDPSR